MGRLRLCMLTTFYPPYHFGGDGVGIQRHCHALVRRGHHVTVVHDLDAFAAFHGGPLPEPAPEPEGLVVHRLRTGLGVLAPLATHQLGRPLFAGRRIQRVLVAGHFDVINFHDVSLVGGPALLGAGRAVKLYMAHEHWLVCPPHVRWRHNREA